MNDQRNGRYVRLRYTAMGALAALAAVGGIAGSEALAAKSHAQAHRHGAVADRASTKTPSSPVGLKTHTPQQAVNQQPFLDAIQRLVEDGTITATEGQTVDREIQTGQVDTQTLLSSGFSQTQLEAVQQALANAKRALAPGAGGPTAPKQPPAAGTGAPSCAKQPGAPSGAKQPSAPSGAKQPPPTATAGNGTPK